MTYPACQTQWRFHVNYVARHELPLVTVARTSFTVYDDGFSIVHSRIKALSEKLPGILEN